MTKRALGYARVSSIEQALGTSLRDQQDSIRAFAASRGVKDVTFFVEAESGVGEKLERRVQMAALMKAVRRGDLVICDKLDRWSRDTEHTLRSIREIREAGAVFHAVHERYDSSSAEGDLMLTIRAALAKEEHARIKLRMVGTRKLVRDRGYYVEGNPPLGYRRAHPKGYKGIEKNVLLVVPEEAETVRAIFSLYVESGRSMTEIAARLGLKLDRVKDALHRRLYTGEIKTSQGWVRGQHEAIVSPALFQRAQEISAERRTAPPSPQAPGVATGDWILRDVARCGLCGAKMSAAYGGGSKTLGRFYYRCSASCGAKYVPVRYVESLIVPHVVARLDHVRSAIEGTKPKREARAEVDNSAALDKLAAKRARVVDLYAEGTITKEELETRLRKLDAEKAKLETAAANAPRLADPKVRRKALTWTEAVEEAWEEGPEARRRIVNALAYWVRLKADGSTKVSWRTPEELLAEAGPLENLAHLLVKA